ncbi:MAG: arginyltransferase [Arenicellaceae bacterium]|nr:arginyltransferase [Arenicellaceae bacterium]
MNKRVSKISLYLTIPEPCPYLEARNSTSLVVDPEYSHSLASISQLTRNGFRRSGNMIYRPHCDNCKSCVSVRIPVKVFRPNRSQRRVLKKNHDIVVERTNAYYDAEHFKLYLKYQKSRHPESSMCDDDPQRYREFLMSKNTDTWFNCFYLDNKLIAVSVIDRLDDGVSAAYTFFDPDMYTRSLGTFAILEMIKEVKSKELDYVYLGYWIEESEKMNYKTRFAPLEFYLNQRWIQIKNPAS